MIFFYVSVIVCLYLLFYISNTRLRPPLESELTYAQGKVTILVCMRNAEHEIDAFIRLISEQEYKNKQLLLVDDQSSDQTFRLIQNWREQFPEWIDILKLEDKQVHGKKGAILKALPYVKGDYILFTDIDCHPQSPLWMNYMIAPLQLDEVDITIGHVIKRTPSSFLGILQRFQSFWKSIQFLGFAQRGKAYMAMGGNWAVNAKKYLLQQNIASHADIASGDDDLVFQALQSKKNVEVILDEKSWVLTEEDLSLKEHFLQRGRHMSTFSAYDGKANIRLISAPLLMLLGIISMTVLVSQQFILAVLIFAVYFIFGLRMMAASAKVIPAGFPIVLAPLLLPIEFLFQGIGFLVTLGRKKSDWT